MGIRKLPGWLLLWLLISILVSWVGLIMGWTHIPAVRDPGRVLKLAGWVASVPAILLYVALSTSRALRQERYGSLTSKFWPLAQQGIYFAAGPAWILLFLATQGNAAALGTHPAHVNSSGWLPWIESFVMVEGLLFVLLFTPEIVRRKLPFEQASEQAVRLVPSAFAALATLITGSYLLSLHFFNQPLARTPLGPLAASILAVMTLLAPLYQLIARACWRYGLADLLDPAAWWDKWKKVKEEITIYSN